MRNRVASAGFTLVELLIAALILTIVTAQVLMVFTTQHTSYVAQERVVDLQQDARLVLDLMLRDLRMAGFMVPPSAAVSSRDGGNSASDVLCVSDATYMADAQVVAAAARFDRAVLGGNLGPNEDQVTVTPATMDIDGDGNGDFDDGQGLIIADGTNTHCARIVTAAAGGAIDFVPKTPGGFTATAGLGRAVPAVIYEITGGGLSRNGVLLSSQIEDLQVEFGIDLDDDDDLEPNAIPAEAPFNDLTGQNLSLVRAVQVTLVARVANEDPLFSGNGRPSVANRTLGGADGFRRRSLSGIAYLRNML